MNKYFRPLIGIGLMISSLFSATLKIDTTWHYFGNGVIFGLGLALVIGFIRKTMKS